MRYRLSYDPRVRRQLADAIRYYLTYHPDAGKSGLLRIADQAFTLARQFPAAMPLDASAESGGLSVRRVSVWRFIFLYRVDEVALELVVEDIFHERSGTTRPGLAA